MKKRVVAAMLVCVMGAAMLAGCGSKTDDTKTNSAAKLRHLLSQRARRYI